MSVPTSDGPRAPAQPRRTAMRAQVERVFEHAPDTRSLFLRLVSGGPLEFVPGQFVSISIPLADETRVRPYTIASSPEDGEPLEICFNLVPGGAGVRYLFERRVGDELDLTGPFGAFTLARAPEAEAVFIAEGTAVAPVRPMIRRALAARPHPPIHLLYAADAPAHVLYRGEFEALAASNPDFRFEVLICPVPTSRRELYDGLGCEVERRWVSGDGDRRRQFYVCGVGSGVLALRDLLRAAGYERRAVHYEKW